MSLATSPLDDVFAVILAGGSGTRFWPKSRQKTPKQLCIIGGAEHTMLEMTLTRLDLFIPPERRLIVTHTSQAVATQALVGNHCPAILAEPEARNTANALAFAALEVEFMAKSLGIAKPLMISLHADHIIQDIEAFKRALMTAVLQARRGALVLLGIVPRYAETGYGYIERGEALAVAVPGALATYQVASFREKPPREQAAQFVASGLFYWNAGLFIWQVSTLLDELAKRLPPSLQALQTLRSDASTSLRSVPQNQVAEVYRQLPKISIDHAVLEVSDNVVVVEADIGWQDVGSWDALAQCFPTDEAGNIAYGDVLLIDSNGTTVDSDQPFVACLGMTDTIVVCAKGAVLVCPTSRAQDVKKIVERLTEQNRIELL